MGDQVTQAVSGHRAGEVGGGVRTQSSGLADPQPSAGGETPGHELWRCQSHAGVMCEVVHYWHGYSLMFISAPQNKTCGCVGTGVRVKKILNYFKFG